MVTLLVGEKETPFNVHMDLLCKASPFFKSAFMGVGDFQETSTKSMKLPEDDPATMDRLIQWIYFGCYSVDSEIETNSADQLEEVLHASLMQLSTLYVVADKYGIIELQNHALGRLFDLGIQGKVELTRNKDLIRYIYENTIAGSKLRKLLVNWYIWRVPNYFKSWTDKDVADHAGFAADVLERFAARVRGISDPFVSGCQYKFYESLEDEGGDNEESEDESSANETLEDEGSDSGESDSEEE